MTLRSRLIFTALAAMSAAAAPSVWAQVQEPVPPAQEFPSPEQETAPAPSSSDMPSSTDTHSSTDMPSADAQSSMNSTTAAAPITDQKIEQFADAYVAVQNIQEKASSDLQTAKDPAAADQVKASAESDMIAAVEKSGLKVDEFNQIVQTMTADVSVRERVAAKLQERQGGGGSP